MEDNESDESVRWKQNPETQRRVKALQKMASTQLQELKAAAAVSNDPAVRDASARYQATSGFLGMLEGAPK